MPTPIRWSVPSELSPEETRVTARLHRSGKFYVFLRTIRGELFDDAFQAELAAVYEPRGTQPRPAGLLAMVLLLQAYEQVSDAEAVENATVDLRWQLVLGCLGAEHAPFSQGALVAFRERLMRTTSTNASSTRRWPWRRRAAALAGSISGRRSIPRRCSARGALRIRGI
jgi:hypothetical protein